MQSPFSGASEPLLGSCSSQSSLMANQRIKETEPDNYESQDLKSKTLSSSSLLGLKNNVVGSNTKSSITITGSKGNTPDVATPNFKPASTTADTIIDNYIMDDSSIVATTPGMFSSKIKSSNEVSAKKFSSFEKSLSPPPKHDQIVTKSSAYSSSSFSVPDKDIITNYKEKRSDSNRRFLIYEDGTHEHCLKAAKRHEKIGSIIKDLLGAKKLRDEAVSAVPHIFQHYGDQPPSLMHGFLKKVNDPNNSNAHLAYDNPNGFNKDGFNYSNSCISSLNIGGSFFEKYGRCQEVIGKGAFGVVRISHKAGDRKTGKQEQLYAVKEFKRKPQETEKHYNKRLTSEFCISSSLHHPNIIHTLDLLQDAKGDYCEVMEFCSGGDLYSLILSAGKLEYQEADCLFKQIIRGVNYMHDMGVAHRDLKPENILLTLKGTVKITDFGNGECFRMAWEMEVHLSNGLCGSAPYIAPEEYSDKEFDPRAVDIWATGVIYMAMRTGRHLWRTANADEDEFYSRYLKGRKDENGYEAIENLKRARCRNVIYSILDPVPSRRITGKQILNSEWGREIRVCEAGEHGL